VHRYFGPKIHSYHGVNELQLINRGFSTNPDPQDRTFSLNTLPLETSTQGSLDFRIANYQFRNPQGYRITAFEYAGYQITNEKPKLPGLPSLSGANTQTLEITLKDAQQNLEMILRYTLFENLPVISRSVEYINKSSQPIYLENAGSMMLDLPSANYDLLTLNGAHTNEANLSRQALHSGIQRVDSTRGTSSPQHQPFIALADKYTTEDQGAVMGFQLIYSGNFIAQVEVEQYGSCRLQMGINPDTFEWKLSPNEHFVTPEAVINYSDTGLNKLSQTFHSLYQNYLVPVYWQKRTRPILLNTWEGNYFSFHEKTLLEQAKTAKELGIELFVLDDGWFGQRNDDTQALGDWYVNQDKLPQKITGLADQIHELGLLFGLWFEPEMISKNSQLFRQHPDWPLQVPAYPLTEGRRQLVLDLSNPEIQDFLIATLDEYLKNGEIDYIKWDMNRHLTEVGNKNLPADQQKEISHRYVLGLYRVLETITRRYPKVLFENCSSGGGRFDPGMMAYIPQTWASDNTDAFCRTKIQTGFSYLFPPIMLGSHVSDVPNHQVGRITPLSTRGHIAMSGNFGYELDIKKQTPDTLAKIKEQVAWYKEHRQLIQFGNFYRLHTPDEQGVCAWLFANDQEVLIVYFHGVAQPAQKLAYLQTTYLDPQALYQNTATNEIFSGDELNHAGILIPRLKSDFASFTLHFKKI
ncbi:TPA: alpha-galactosidase, partial [Enterobacter hormaechei subsp. xiangfangensis]|nr:alpha-galactosidase [Enterobacter hormaechei subsp. xiangfangensis]